MIIGIPADKKDENSLISGSFGRSPFYFIYNDETKNGYFMVNTGEKSQGGAGIKAASALLEEEIDVLITPQLGENAFEVVKAADVRIYKSVKDSLINNVLSFKDSKLEELKDIHKGHHGH